MRHELCELLLIAYVVALVIGFALTFISHRRLDAIDEATVFDSNAYARWLNRFVIGIVLIVLGVAGAIGWGLT